MIKNNDSLLLSIVSICFNDIQNLQKTSESIDYHFSFLDINFEHIVIDGNSKDGTQEYLFDRKNKLNHNFNFISENDDGIYDAMNKGIDLARGEYLLFLNAGDLISNKFEINEFILLLKKFSSSNISVLAFNTVLNIYEIKKINHKSRNINMNFKIKMPAIHQSIIFKTEIIGLYKFNKNFKICGDFDNIVRMMHNHEEIYPCDLYLSEFLIGGISSDKPNLLISESFSILKAYSPNILIFIRSFISIAFNVYIFYIYKILLKFSLIKKEI